MSDDLCPRPEGETRYLITLSLYVHDTISSELLKQVRVLMTAASRRLASSGQLLRVWQPPLPLREWRTLGIFVAFDREELEILFGLVRQYGWCGDVGADDHSTFALPDHEADLLRVRAVSRPMRADSAARAS